MKTNIIVRQTTEADYPIVYNLIKTAFETAEHRDGTEQDFAVGLRNGGNYLPELDLVAELDGQGTSCLQKRMSPNRMAASMTS